MPLKFIAALRSNAGRGLVVAIILGVAWFLALEGSPAPQSEQPSDSAFQPVPNTSPVPTDFLSKQAPPSRTQRSQSRTEFILFQSKALARPMHYLVYEPAGYDSSSDRRYPVLYMLHGIGGGFGGTIGNETEWPGYGLLAAADRLIASGQIEPLLIVLPESDQSYWMDAANGGPKYGAYVTDDLVDEIDGRFRTMPDRQQRAIGGLSMGGFGAFALAMLRPDEFGIAGAHSPSLTRLAKGPAFFGDAHYFGQHDPVQLMYDRPEAARSVRLWVDVAAQDPLWKDGAEALHDELLERGIAHEWRQWPGKHDGVYWGSHMEDYLRFYSAALSV